MRETALLTHIFSRSADLAARFPGIETGPGDDCAVVRIGAERLLLKVDQLVEGRHYPANTPVSLVARKALARAVSDIAAMAGSPLFGLAAATLPHGYPQHQADALFDALASHARAWGCPLVGGDIASASSESAPLVLGVTIVGRPHPVRGPVLRSGALPADELFVTGSLGGSLDPATGLGRHLTFEPRLAEAAWLADTLGPHLHAMMDISDGLGIDAGRLANASRVDILIDGPSLPLSTGVTAAAQAIGDGEDYELLFCASPGSLPARGTCPNGCPFTRIGSVTPGIGRAAAILDGNPVDVSERGWQHT